MPGDDFLSSTYDAAMLSYQAELAEAQAEFQKARFNYDSNAAAEAGKKLADIRTRMGEFQRMAEEHVAAVEAAPKPNPHNLTDAQMEAAEITGTTPEEYARGVRELNRLKREGHYKEGQH